MGVMVLHVVTDVGSRYFVGHPLNGTTEIVSRYYMVTLIFLPLAYVQAMDKHITANLLGGVLPPRFQVLLRCLAAILMGMFAALLCWRAGTEAMRATAISEQIQTAFYFLPTWPARWILVLAMAFVVFQSVVEFLVQSTLFVQWNRKTLQQKKKPAPRVTPI